MTRVSSFGQQQLLLEGIFNNQQKVFTAQQQLTTGNKTDEFRGLAGQATTLASTKGFKSRVESYQATIDTVRGRLDANDVQLQGVLDTARELRENILTVLGQNQAAGFRPLLEESYAFVANSLNANVGGQYLFAGSKVDTPPVNALTLTDLVAAPTVADVFDNDADQYRARVADNVEVTFGVLASDIGQDLFTTIRTIAEFDANIATGPIDGELTAAQRTFLETELANLDAAIDGIQTIQVDNGLTFDRLETIGDQHADTDLFLEVFIADIEEVDTAEAITRLNNDLVALQASYQSVSTLTQLTLLDFI